MHVLKQKAFELWKKHGYGRNRLSKILNVSPNTIRNWLREFRKLENNQNISNIDIKQEINSDIEYERLKSTIKKYKLKYQEAIKQLHNAYDLADKIETHVKSLPAPNKVRISIDKDISTKTKENLTMLLSDFHINEVVNKEEMNGINEYNFKEFERRIKNVFGNVIGIVKYKLSDNYTFETLYIDFLGDILSGHIHEELIINEEMNIIDACVNGALVVAKCISAISIYFPKVILNCITTSNHSRLTKKIHYKQAFVGWDYLFYKLLQMYLKEHKNITFNISKSFIHIYKNYNFNVMMMHGQGIRIYNGVPYYGINRTVLQLQRNYAKTVGHIDIIEMGHFHQEAILTGNIILNGSLIGANEYALGKYMNLAKPYQIIYGVHKENGMTFRYYINPLIESKIKIN